jgi:predicted metal-dependent phosphoesterase TrpH
MHPPTVADLHLHSHHSDGLLSPAAMVALAAERGVTLAALTDHDTLAGCAEAAAAAAASGIRCITGVELTAAWRGQSVHVIGLAPDPACGILQAHAEGLRQRRRERLRAIGERLSRKAGLPGAALAEAVCAAAPVATRMHLARGLVEAGHARDVGDAFDRWLGRGQPGHVPAEWPGLEATVAALRAAGARVVLAHAHRYRLSGGALRQLVAEFRAHGGDGMEVSVGGMSRNDLDRLATLARRERLAASCGSDFHDPALPWNSPGRFAKLPTDLEPIASRL